MGFAKSAFRSAKFCRRALRKLPKSLSERRDNRLRFGKGVAKQIFIHSLNEKPYSEEYMAEMRAFVEEDLAEITEKYQKLPAEPLKKEPTTGKIKMWTCWWQGEEAMPPIVKACIGRMRNIFRDSNAELVVITEKNVDDYIRLPAYIYELFRKGAICHAHLADIIRWGLVATCGGGWCDACDYLCRDEAAYYLGKLNDGFYTAKFRSPDDCPHEPSRGMWANQYFFAERESILVKYVYEALLYYWKKHEKAFDYVFLDYIILCAYNNIPRCRELIDNVPPNSETFYEFRWKMKDPFDEALYQQAMSSSDFYNISYKMSLSPYTDDQRLTFYGYLLQVNGLLLQPKASD